MKYILIISTFFLVALSSCKDELSDLMPSDWIFSDPQSHDLNPYPLLKLDKELKEGNYGDIHSLTILKNNNLIFENYYLGSSPDQLEPLGRGTQSIFYLISEELMLQSKLNLSDSIIQYINGYDQYFDNIPLKDRITLYDLINNRSGFWWNEWDFTNFSSPNDKLIMEEQNDWVDYILSKPMIREPGVEFNYNSGHTLLYSYILESQSSRSLDESIDEMLFSPIGIKDWQWDKTPAGRLNTISGLHLTARDMAKIGMLLLQKGEWNEEPLINRLWSQNILNPTIISNLYSYRMGWFKFGFYHPLNSDRTIPLLDFVFLWGEKGQFIFVSPEKELVIVFTGDLPEGKESDYIFSIFKKYIIPSITEGFSGI